MKFLSDEAASCIIPPVSSSAKRNCVTQVIQFTGPNIAGNVSYTFKHLSTPPLSIKLSDNEFRDALALIVQNDVRVTSQYFVDSSGFEDLSYFINFDQDQNIELKIAHSLIEPKVSVSIESIQQFCDYVSVSLNGVDSFGRFRFVYDDAPQINDITPTHGPSTGGTLVMISTEDAIIFGNRTKYICVFGEVESVGHLVNQRAVSCRTPVHKVAIVNVSLKFFSYFDENALISTSNIFYDFVDGSYIDDINPGIVALGSFSSAVDVSGQFYAEPDELLCQYTYINREGSEIVIIVEAELISSTFLTCTKRPVIDEGVLDRVKKRQGK